MTRIRKPCQRCKGEGQVKTWRMLSPRELVENNDALEDAGCPVTVDREIIFIECGTCLGTGFDESAEALSGDG